MHFFTFPLSVLVSVFTVVIYGFICFLAGALTALVYAVDKDTLRRLNWGSIKVSMNFRKCYKLHNYVQYLFSCAVYFITTVIDNFLDKYSIS